MGFLDGLSNLASGAASRLKSAGGGLLDNMLPIGSVTSTPGADLGAVPQGLPGAGEPLQAAPQLQQHGLLERMGTADARGMNFGDKLFALSQMMQGDTQGAASFMHQQRTTHDALQQRQLAADNAKAGLEALRKNIGADGALDIQGYLAALPPGADPMEGLKAREALQPDYGVMSTAEGGVLGYNKRNPHESFEMAKGTPKAPQKYVLKPGGDPNDINDWSINPLVAQLEESTAAAHRRGAPLAPRVGRMAAGGGIPAGYESVN